MKLTKTKQNDIIYLMELNEEIEFSTGKPMLYEVYVTNDKNFIMKHSNEILKLVKDSYEPLGGNKSLTRKEDFKNVSIAKFVFNDNHQIIALALYRDNLGGNKRFASASDKNDPKHLNAVQAIIKNDIEPYDNWYWIEASGPIEHYFKKHNGNPIPNYLVYKFLQKPKKDIELNDDGIHYRRFLNSSDLEPTEKMMFGFKNQDAMNFVLNKIDNYSQFKIDINNAIHDLFEDEIDATKDDKSFMSALVFIQELDEKYEGGFNEMLPSWKDQLKYAIARILKEQKKKNLTKEKINLIDSNLNLARFLIKRMPLLKAHQFHM